MRIALFYLALVGLLAAFWTAFWPLDRPAPAAVPLAALYAVETELSEQAGAGDADRKLLDAMQAAAKSPADRAEVLRRSCGLHANVAGPQAAIAICAQAIVVARTADPATHHRTGRRLAKVLAGAGDGAGALAVLNALPRAQEGLEGALTAWVRAETLQGLQRAPEALASAQEGARQLTLAQRTDPALLEYTAIADYWLGRTSAAAGDAPAAQVHLQRALDRQRGLDATNPGWRRDRPAGARIRAELARRLADETLTPDPRGDDHAQVDSLAIDRPGAADPDRVRPGRS